MISMCISVCVYPESLNSSNFSFTAFMKKNLKTKSQRPECTQKMFAFQLWSFCLLSAGHLSYLGSHCRNCLSSLSLLLQFSLQCTPSVSRPLILHHLDHLCFQVSCTMFYFLAPSELKSQFPFIFSMQENSSYVFILLFFSSLNICSLLFKY